MRIIDTSNLGGKSVAARLVISLPGYVVIDLTGGSGNATFSFRDSLGTSDFVLTGPLTGEQAATLLAAEISNSDFEGYATVAFDKSTRVIVTALASNSVFELTAWSASYVDGFPVEEYSRTLSLGRADEIPDKAGLSGSDWIPCLGEIDPLRVGIDPVDRTIEVSTLDVEIMRNPAVDFIRMYFDLHAIPVAYQVGGRGTGITSTYDWKLVQSFFLKEIVDNEPGVSVTMRLHDVFGLLDRGTIEGQVVAKHPLEVAAWIVESVFGSNVASYVDMSTLAYDVDLTRSHFVVSRFKSFKVNTDNTLGTGANALALLGEIAFLMQGTFRTASDGRMEFVPEPSSYPPSRAVVLDCNLDSPTCNFVTVEEQGANLLNTISVDQVSGVSGSEGMRASFQSTKGLKATNGVVVDKSIEAAWLNGACNGSGPCFDAGPTGAGSFQFPGADSGASSLAYGASGATSISSRAEEFYYDSERFSFVDGTVRGVCGCRKVLDTATNVYVDELPNSGASSLRKVYLQLIPSGPGAIRVSLNSTDQRGNPAFTKDALTNAVDSSTSAFADEIVAVDDIRDPEGWGDVNSSGPGQAYDYPTFAARFRQRPSDEWRLIRESAQSNLSSTDLVTQSNRYPFLLTARVDTSYNEEGFTNGRTGLGTVRSATDPQSGNIPYAWRMDFPTDATGLTNPRALIVDVTIPVRIGQSLLRKFSRGSPKIKLQLDWSVGLQLQLGDVVGILASHIVAGHYGPLDSSACAFEVTEIAYDLMEDSPQVEVVAYGVADRNAYDVAIRRNSRLPPASPVTNLPVVTPVERNEVVLTTGETVQVSDQDADGVDETVIAY